MFLLKHTDRNCLSTQKVNLNIFHQVVKETKQEKDSDRTNKDDKDDKF